jgi:hypothetical protein
MIYILCLVTFLYTQQFLRKLIDFTYMQSLYNTNTKQPLSQDPKYQMSSKSVKKFHKY